MPVGEEAIIERLLNQLLKCDKVDTVTVSLGYMGILLKTYVESKFPSQKINYTFESEPLGTAGALTLLPNISESDKILVVNGDTYTDFKFQEIFIHLEENPAVIVTHKRSVNIDYGVISIDSSGYMSKYIEKPKTEYTISTGIYGLHGRHLNYLGSGNQNMPDLLVGISKDEAVLCLHHDGLWMDLGRAEDLIMANDIVLGFQSE